MTRPRVLVTDGGGGQNLSSLAAVRALAAAGYEAHVTRSAAGHSLASASRACARAIEVAPAHDPGYAEAVHRLLRTGRYLAVIPASDAAVLALGLPGGDVVDKDELARRASAAGFNPVPGRTFPSGTVLAEAADDLEYPAVVKVARKRSARFPGAVRVDGPSDVRALERDAGPFIVQPHLGEHVRAVAGVTSEGQFLAVGHQRHRRLWPPDAGDGTWIETTAPDLELEERILEVVRGYEGILQAELIGPHLLDLNPRAYGSMSLMVAAGVNLPAIHLDGGRTLTFAPPLRARENVTWRWLEGDLRHLFARVRTGRTSLGQAYRAFRTGSVDQHALFDAADPGPAVVRARHILRRIAA